jgi:hypothetical protein
MSEGRRKKEEGRRKKDEGRRFGRVACYAVRTTSRAINNHA